MAGLLLMLLTYVVAQDNRYWGSYSLATPGGSGAGDSTQLLQLPVTAPHHHQAAVLQSTLAEHQEFSRRQADIVQQHIQQQAFHAAPHQQQPQLEQLQEELSLKVRDFQRGMQPMPVDHVQHALASYAADQQEFSRQQASLIQQQIQQQQQRQLPVNPGKEFSRKQHELIQQQVQQQQQRQLAVNPGKEFAKRQHELIQQQIQQQEVARHGSSQVGAALGQQQEFRRQQLNLIEHQIQHQSMQQLLQPQQQHHPLTAEAVAQQHQFSRQQTEMIQRQIQQQTLDQQQLQKQPAERPAWLQMLINQEGVTESRR